MSLLQDILFPRRCLLCEQLLYPWEEGMVCGECQISDLRITGTRCRICSRPVREEGSVCRSCLMHGTTVPGKAFFRYSGAMRESIHRFKYGDQRCYAEGYAELICQDLDLTGCAALVPIPIHRSRRAERGYNQAAELAKALAKRTGVPAMELIRRVRKTGVQNRLSAKARRDNLKGAFRAVRAEVPEGTLVIIDDIYTSGSTIETAAEVLREAYPGHPVRFLTVAMRLMEDQEADT